MLKSQINVHTWGPFIPWGTNRGEHTFLAFMRVWIELVSNQRPFGLQPNALPNWATNPRREWVVEDSNFRTPKGVGLQPTAVSHFANHP